jgi:hypothetical protein
MIIVFPLCESEPVPDDTHVTGPHDPAMHGTGSSAAGTETAVDKPSTVPHAHGIARRRTKSLSAVVARVHASQKYRIRIRP